MQNIIKVQNLLGKYFPFPIADTYSYFIVLSAINRQINITPVQIKYVAIYSSIVFIRQTTILLAYCITCVPVWYLQINLSGSNATIIGLNAYTYCILENPNNLYPFKNTLLV